MIWIRMEINILTMCYLISKDIRIFKIKQINTVKYFTVQALASILILLGSILEYNKILILIILATKIGCWPIHNWYLNLIYTIRIKIKRLVVLITWQKALPVLIIKPLTRDPKGVSFVITITAFTIIAPLISIKKNTRLKNTIAASSVNNNGWLIARILASTRAMVSYLIVYRATLWLVIQLIRHPQEPNTTLINIINLRRFPPIPIFWAKVIILQKAIENLTPSWILLLMILGAFGFTYFYLRPTILNLVKREKEIRYTTRGNTIPKTMLLTGVSIIVLILRLGFT